MVTTDKIIEVKKPQLKTQLNNILEKRFSPRVFSKEIIEDRDILKISEAARWAPSSSNRQPWFFYLIKNGTPSFQLVLGSLDQGNYWAKEAPLLIVGCYLKEDKYGINKYAEYDLGQSVMSMVVEINSLGYYCRQMGGFNKEKIANDLHILSPVFPWVLIAVGKIGNYEKTNPALVEKDNRIRTRKEEVAKEI